MREQEIVNNILVRIESSVANREIPEAVQLWQRISDKRGDCVWNCGIIESCVSDKCCACLAEKLLGKASELYQDKKATAYYIDLANELLSWSDNNLKN